MPPPPPPPPVNPAVPRTSARRFFRTATDHLYKTSAGARGNAVAVLMFEHRMYRALVGVGGRPPHGATYDWSSFEAHWHAAMMGALLPCQECDGAVLCMGSVCRYCRHVCCDACSLKRGTAAVTNGMCNRCRDAPKTQHECVICDLKLTRSEAQHRCNGPADHYFCGLHHLTIFNAYGECALCAVGN